MLAGVTAAGCVGDIRAPDVNINTRPEPPPVSTADEPQTYDEALAAWRAAMRRNAYLEDKAADLERDKRKLKDERDEYKDRYKRLKDKYED